MRSRIGLFCLTAVGMLLLLGAQGCTKKSPSSEKVDQLFLELERKYIRSYDKNGYSINYSVQEPNTIVITLRYKPGTEQEQVGRNVLSAAETFAKSMAREKYGIDVQTKTVSLPMTD